jgi:hypothetical protein
MAERRPFYRPPAVGPFLAAGVVLSLAIGLALGALVGRARWLWITAISLCLAAGAIPPVAVHTISQLRQLVEHPLVGVTQVYTARPDGQGDVYLIRGNDEVIRLTDTKALDINADLSPDGRHVAYSSDAAGSLDLYVMTLDEHDRPENVRRLTSLPGDEYVDRWSPMVRQSPSIRSWAVLTM